MSIILIEGFDYYRNIEDTNHNYWYFFNRYPNELGGVASLIDLDSNTSFKRFPESKKCIALSAGSSNLSDIYLYKPINPQTGEIVFGAALRYEYKSTSSSIPYVFSLIDTGGSVALSIGLNTLKNRYEIYNEAGNFVGSTPDNVFSQSNWHYLEIEANVSSSSTIRLYIDGELKKEISNVDTLNSGVSDKKFKILRFGPANSGSSSADMYIDDIYFLDKNGYPSTPLGKVRIDFLSVASAISSNMNPSSGTDQASLLRDNTDTTYISTSATGASALFSLSSLSHDPKNIYAVSPVVRDKKTAPYPLSHLVSLEENGNVISFSAKSTETDVSKRIIYTSSPSGELWTKEKINNLKLKLERK